MEERVACGQFRLKDRIGSGSFGEIYSARALKTGGEVAVKIESSDLRIPQLSFEATVYSICQNGVNIPRFYFYGEEPKFKVMAIQLLGRSIESHFHDCHRHFSLKTVLMLADQMLCAIEYFHNRHFIHRDIKPENFVFGLGSQSNQLFAIDFGLAKKYRDPTTLAHIPYGEHRAHVGTARYASIRSLAGIESSRRDDMESLGYIWIYLLRGNLPWMGLKAGARISKAAQILAAKRKLPVEELCADMPPEFPRYLNSVRSLKFSEQPSYSSFRAMFRELFIRSGFIFDGQYDWNERKCKRERPATVQPPKRRQYEVEVFEWGRRAPIIHNPRLVPNYDTSVRRNSETRHQTTQMSARGSRRLALSAVDRAIRE